ncbi:MAG: superoxide dismutase [Actinomycetota bacterium]|nr:superoxide dismutase [Actinomycetota bacterium]
MDGRDSRLRRGRTVWAVAAVMASLVLVPASAVSAQAAFPEVIALPNGWQPEGIAKGPGTTMFSGSRATGDVIAVNVATGATRLVVDAPPGRSATGLEQDRWGRLWVSGGATGQAYVYGPDGNPVATFQLGTPPTSFINDVVITRDAAWFTDSQDAALWKIPIGPRGAIGQPQRVPLTGQYQHQPGFNLNGIDATPGGRWLIAVQSNTGLLYRIDPATGFATVIDLGGVTLANGDGILLIGNRLYVVQNRLNQVAVVHLDPRTFASGRVVGTLTSPNFDVPTTVAPLGNRLYLVNARFTTPAEPTTPYTMVAIPRR